MKVPTRKRRNPQGGSFPSHRRQCLNESPYEKVGKCRSYATAPPRHRALNESPSKKEGKFEAIGAVVEDTIKPQ